VCHGLRKHPQNSNLRQGLLIYCNCNVLRNVAYLFLAAFERDDEVGGAAVSKPLPCSDIRHFSVQ